MNGYFQLVITPKGTGIRVYAPTDGGEPLNVNDVRDYLDDRKIQYDVVTINDAVTKAEENVVIFTEAQLLPEREGCKFDISKDRMTVTAFFYPPSEGAELMTEKEVMDSLAYKYSPYMPQQFKTALKKLKSQELEEPVSNLSEDLINQRYLEFGEQFRELFKYYPCMKECVNGFAVSSYPAVLFSAACMYGTLATRLYYFHYHEPEQQRRLNYEVFVIADPASGKSGIGKLYKIIMSPLILEDKVYNDSINKNKKAHKVNESVKDKERKKIDVVESKVRIHGSRTANNVFIEDMVNNVEEIDGELVHLHLFTFDAELEAAQQAAKGGQ